MSKQVFCGNEGVRWGLDYFECQQNDAMGIGIFEVNSVLPETALSDEVVPIHFTSDCTVMAQVGERDVICLVDSGSSINLVSEAVNTQYDHYLCKSRLT